MLPDVPKLAIKSGAYTYFIRKEDIIFLKAEGAYTVLYLNNQQEITLSKSLKLLEEELQISHFFRTHNSYTINLLHLLRYKNNGDNYLEMSNGEHVPLARSRKPEFFQLFRRL